MALTLELLHLDMALELLTACFCYTEQDEAAAGPRTSWGGVSSTRSEEAEVNTVPTQHQGLLVGLLN